MKKRKYEIKNLDDVKKHKLFRGMRCYMSSLITSKNRIKPDADVKLRCYNVVNRLLPNEKNVALLSFKKSEHNAIIINSSNNRFNYVSAYNNEVAFIEFLDKNEMIELLVDEVFSWGDQLKDENIVYIKGLDTNKMREYIHSSRPNFQYKLFNNNCARYAADVLLAGCAITPDRFIHNRIWQMPANTLELAKEIDRSLRSGRMR